MKPADPEPPAGAPESSRASGLRGAFLAAVCAAFLIRVCYLIVFHPAPAGNSQDAAGFIELARNVAAGAGYVDQYGYRAWRFPVTPLFAAAHLALPGGSLRAVQFSFAVLGALTAGLVALTAGRVFGRAAAWVAGMLAAVYPMFVYMTGVVLTENISLFLTTAALYALVRWREGPHWGLALAAGAAMGVECLNRPTIALFVPFALAWMVWVRVRAGARRRAAVHASAALAVAVAVLVPWWVRNYRIFDEFVPLSSMGGQVFVAGNNHAVLDFLKGETSARHVPGGPVVEGAAAGATPYGYVWPREEFWRTYRKLSELEQSRFAYREGLRFIREHPGQALLFDLYKLYVFWIPYNHWVHRFSYWPLVALALGGAVLARGRGRGRVLALMYALVATRAAAAMVFQAVPRYRVPIMPCLILLAALALVTLFARLRGRTGRAAPAEA